MSSQMAQTMVNHVQLDLWSHGNSWNKAARKAILTALNGDPA